MPKLKIKNSQIIKYNTHNFDFDFYKDPYTRYEKVRFIVDVLGNYYGKVKVLDNNFTKNDIEDWAIELYLRLLKKLCL